MKKLIFGLIALMTMAGCAEMSQFMKDQPEVSFILVKNTVVVPNILITDDPLKRKEYAEKLIKVADGAIAAIESETVLSKEKIIEIFNKELAKQDMDVLMKSAIQDLMVVLNMVYPVDIPTVIIPEEYRSQLIQVFGYIKSGASLFI